MKNPAQVLTLTKGPRGMGLKMTNISWYRTTFQGKPVVRVVFRYGLLNLPITTTIWSSKSSYYNYKLQLQKTEHNIHLSAAWAFGMCPKRTKRQKSTLDVTYRYEIHLQPINGVKNAPQVSPCARSRSNHGFSGLLGGHALWVRVCEQLGRRLAEVVDHALGRLAFVWISDGVQVYSTLRIIGMRKFRLPSVRVARPAIFVKHVLIRLKGIY